MQDEIKEIRTAKITNKGQICIPQEARSIAGFKEGSKISIIVFSDRVEIRSMKKLNEKIFPALATEEVLAKSWNTKEENQSRKK